LIYDIYFLLKMRDPKVYIIDITLGDGTPRRLSHFIRYTSTEDRIYLICIDNDCSNECWVSIPMSLKNTKKPIINWERVEDDDPTLPKVEDMYPSIHYSY